MGSRRRSNAILGLDATIRRRAGVRCEPIGSDLTAPFLRLDSDIDFFAAEWMNEQTTTGIPRPTGGNTGLLDHLVRIEQQATSLRDEARKGREHIDARLQETQGSDS